MQEYEAEFIVGEGDDPSVDSCTTRKKQGRGLKRKVSKKASARKNAKKAAQQNGSDLDSKVCRWCLV